MLSKISMKSKQMDGKTGTNLFLPRDSNILRHLVMSQEIPFVFHLEKKTIC